MVKHFKSIHVHHFTITRKNIDLHHVQFTLFFSMDGTICMDSIAWNDLKSDEFYEQFESINYYFMGYVVALHL